MAIGGRLNFSGATSYTDPTAGLRKAGDVFANIMSTNDANRAKATETARVQGNADRAFALQKAASDRAIINADRSYNLNKLKADQAIVNADRNYALNQASGDRARINFEQQQTDDTLAGKLISADQTANRNISNLNNQYANATPEQLADLNANAVASAEAGAFQGATGVLNDPTQTAGASSKMILNERDRLDKLALQEQNMKRNQLRDINTQTNADARLGLARETLELNKAKAGSSAISNVKDLQAYVKMAQDRNITIAPEDTIDTIKAKLKTQDTELKTEASVKKEERKVKETQRKEVLSRARKPGKYLGEISGINMDEEATTKLNQFLKKNGADTPEKKVEMVDFIASQHKTSVLPNIWDTDFEDTLDRLVSNAGLNQNY